MQLLYVCRLYSGFRESVDRGRWAPSGAPAAARMIQALAAGPHHLEVVFTDKDRPGPVRRVAMEGLPTEATIVGAVTPSGALRRMAPYLTDLRHLIHVWRRARAMEADAVYFDRGNILPAAAMARFGGWPVLLRVLGITPDMKTFAGGRRPFHRLMRWAFRAPFALVICTSDGSGGTRWLRRFLRPGVPRYVRLNGIDPAGPATSAVAGTLPADKVKVLFVGRLETMKGCDEFVEALVALKDSHGDRVHGVIVGAGSRENALRRRVAEAAPGMVSILGPLPRGDVAQVQAASDIYVSLNRMGNLSNANLEAMRAGLCLVVPEPDEALDIDVDTRNLLPPDSVWWLPRQGSETEHLAAAIAHLADHPEDRSGRGAALQAAVTAATTSWDDRIAWEIARIEEVAVGRRPDLAVVINDMGSGGAQRVLINLLRAWSAAGRRVSLITFAGEEDDFHPVPDAVQRVVLGGVADSRGMLDALRNNLRRIARLRRALSEVGAPIVLSFIAPVNVLTVLAARGLGLRVIISERNDPGRQSFGRLWDALRRHVYPLADIVTANSQGALDSLRATVPPRRLALVPNPVAVPPEDSATEARAPVFLHVGRLHPQKAQDVLLPAFARIAADLPDWRLQIAGEGPLESDLKALCQRLGIAGRVDWLGRVVDPFPLYRLAGVFCLPSRHEGTPNALLEAMACGLPAIVSDASPGPLDYVRDSQTGLVVPAEDVDALAVAMRRLAADPALAHRLGAAGRKAVAICGLAPAVERWDDVVWSDGGARSAEGRDGGAMPRTGARRP